MERYTKRCTKREYRRQGGGALTLSLNSACGSKQGDRSKCGCRLKEPKLFILRRAGSRFISRQTSDSR